METYYKGFTIVVAAPLSRAGSRPRRHGSRVDECTSLEVQRGLEIRSVTRFLSTLNT